MSSALNGLGHQLFGWLGPLSIELAALALLVLAAGRLIRSPALRHLLWLAVLVKPLIAVAVSSPYTLFAPLAPLAEPGWDAMDHWARGAPGDAGFGWCNHFPEQRRPLTPAGWAALLWLVGTTLLAGRIMIGFGILRRMRRQALVQREGPLFEALQTSACSHRLPSRGRSGDLPFHPLAHGPRHPEAAHPRSRGSPGPTAGGRAHPCPHARACPRAPLRQPRTAARETRSRLPCSTIPPDGCAAACYGASPSRPATISWYAPPVRPEAYARGLTLVAEGAAHSNSSSRRFPMMSTFASTESDLSQRIRRTLNGRARRMGMYGPACLR